LNNLIVISGHGFKISRCTAWLI